MKVVEIASHILAQYTSSWSITWAPNQAFGALAWYIFGDNRTKKKIAMTAPVTSQQTSSQKIAMTAPVITQPSDTWDIITSFSMPAQWTMDTLPTPNNPRVTLVEVPAKTIAIWTFGGYATQQRVETQWQAFQNELQKNNITRSGSMTLAQYNDPRTPPRLRKNELWVDVLE